MQAQKTHIELPIKLVEDMMNYMARRPYIEVASFIAEISKAAGPQVAQPQVVEEKKAA